LVSWFVIKESAFSSNTILHGRPPICTQKDSNWVKALMTNNSFEYMLAD
jgi:hypothetical protein